MADKKKFTVLFDATYTRTERRKIVVEFEEPNTLGLKLAQMESDGSLMKDSEVVDAGSEELDGIWIDNAEVY